MFWFGRPSFFRWIAAGVLVIGAAIIEFRPTGHALYPFTAADVAAGDPVTVDWRELPSGAYEPPEIRGLVAAHALDEGEPISRSDLVPPLDIPEGWWALALEIPTRLAPGTATQLVVADHGDSPIPGIVVSSQDPDRFGSPDPTALIAVPAEHITVVATAARDRRVVVLVAP